MNGRTRHALGFLASAALFSLAVARAWANLDLPAPLARDVAGGQVAAHSGTSTPTPPGVLFVVIDGLRADVAGTLPFLSRLADAGGQARTWADPPTISAAQYVALLTGVPP